MHDVAIALDDKFLGWPHRADLRDLSGVVATEIEQHQVLGKFLFVRQKIGFQRAVFFRGSAAAAGAGNGPYRDFLVENADQNFRARADHLKAPEVEIEHERRRVRAPQRAVKRKRRQRKVLRPALRRHDLENVAGADVLLGALHGCQVSVLGKVRDGSAAGASVAKIAAFARQGAFQIADRIHHPLGGLGIGRAGIEPGTGPGRRDHGDFALYAVEHSNHRGAQHQRIRQAKRIGIYIRQMLDQRIMS